MPRIPEYERQVSLRGTPANPPAVADETGAAIAQLGGAAAGLGVRIAAVQKEQKQKQEAAWTGRTLAETRSAITTKTLAAEDAAQPGAPGFTAALMGDIDATLSAALAGAPSDDARAALEQMFIGLRDSAFEGAHRFERASASAKAALDYQAAIDTNAATLLASPDAFESTIAESTAMAAALLPAQARPEAVRAAHGALTRSYAQGLAQSDPERLREEVLAGRLAPFAAGDDATYLGWAEAEIDRRQAEAERRAKEAQAEAAAVVKQQLGDALAEIEFSGATGIDVERSAAALPAAAQAEVRAALTTAKQFYADTSRLALLDPASRAAVLRSLEPQGAGAADKLRRYEAAARAVAAIEADWRDDPAAAAFRYSPSVRAAIDAAQQPAAAPQAALRAAELSLQVQRQAGVPAPRVLAAGQAKGYVAELADPDRMLPLLDGLAASYGPLWPQVQAELAAAGLPADVQVIEAARPDPVFGPAYIAARTAGEPALRKLVGDGEGGEADVVEAAVDTALAPFIASMPDADVAAATRQAVLLTALELRRRGLDADAAGTRAAATFAGKGLVTQYGYVELNGTTVRVPRAFEPDVIEEGLGEVLQRLGSLPLDVFGGAALPEIERAALVEALQEGGRFVTNEAETGVVLYDEQMAPVLMGGRRVEFDWATLAAFADDADETETPMMAIDPAHVQGLVEPGNIDLFARPRVPNPEGGISTVRSTSFNLDGVEVLIPTVSEDGRLISPEEAIKTYRLTGKHLGKFKDPASATAYAKILHEQQDRFYQPQPPATGGAR